MRPTLIGMMCTYRFGMDSEWSAGIITREYLKGEDNIGLVIRDIQYQVTLEKTLAEVLLSESVWINSKMRNKAFRSDWGRKYLNKDACYQGQPALKEASKSYIRDKK